MSTAGRTRIRLVFDGGGMNGGGDSGGSRSAMTSSLFSLIPGESLVVVEGMIVVDVTSTTGS